MRFHELLPQVQQMPIAGTRPFHINGLFCGFMHPSACDVLQCMEEISFKGHCVDLTCSPALLDAVLADIAMRLFREGCTIGWRDEQLQVFAQDQVVGKMERTAFRALGLLTSAVHLNALTPQGDIYLSKRAMCKLTDPGKWDTLAGGLVNAQDTIESALLRESFEEAGLKESDLTARSPSRRIVRLYRQLPEGFQVEDIWEATVVVDDSSRLHNQDGEVSEIRAFSVTDLQELMRSREVTIEAALVLASHLDKTAY